MLSMLSPPQGSIPTSLIIKAPKSTTIDPHTPTTCPQTSETLLHKSSTRQRLHPDLNSEAAATPKLRPLCERGFCLGLESAIMSLAMSVDVVVDKNRS